MHATDSSVLPANRIAKTEIEKNLTIPNSVNVKLTDETGTLLRNGKFQLLDEKGAVVAERSDNSGCVSANSDRIFNEREFNITVGSLCETGDYHGEILLDAGGGLQVLHEDDLLRPDYKSFVRYISYGEKMANVKTVTIPAGQVWVNVAQGYKCNADPDLAKQMVEYDGTTTATVYVKKGDYTPLLLLLHSYRR